MSELKVRNYLKKFNVDNKIMVFNESTATINDAAKTIGTTTDEIAKSLSFILKNDEAIIIVVSGDSKIDNKKYKEEFNEKCKMIPYNDVEKLIGHAPGGVCPFGINENVKIYLDESLKKHKYVYPACGESNNAIKLTIDELEKYSNYIKWIDVTI